jgi:hypothetical protein
MKYCRTKKGKARKGKEENEMTFHTSVEERRVE